MMGVTMFFVFAEILHRVLSLILMLDVLLVRSAPQALRDEFSSAFLFNTVVCAHGSGEVILQHYNTLFTLSKLARCSDGILVSNGASLCWRGFQGSRRPAPGRARMGEGREGSITPREVVTLGGRCRVGNTQEKTNADVTPRNIIGQPACLHD